MRAADLNILILAAGYSLRLGGPKALARVHGISLLRRTAALAAALAPQKIFAVVPHRCSSYRAQIRGLPVHFLPNYQRASGLGSSVRLGVRQARFAAAILILPVDLIELKARDLRRLLARWRAMRKTLTATCSAEAAGIPLILPARFFPAAEQLAGDIGLRSLLARLTANQWQRVHVPAAAFDIDTPQALAAARRRWRACLP